MAISSRRLSPRDIEAECMLRLSSILTSSSIFSASSRRPFSLLTASIACIRKAPSRLAKSGIIMFSITVRSPKISGVWNTREMPIWQIS